MSNETRQIYIPFQGFYNTVHEMWINDELERDLYLEEYSGSYRLMEKAYSLIDFSHVHAVYSQMFVDAFNDNYQLKTNKFKEVSSPRFYNYETDQILCEISLKELKEIHKKVDEQALRKLVKERCTSYSGFVSFYSNDLDDWGTLETWEVPQLSLLIECHCESIETYLEWEAYAVETGCGTLNDALYHNPKAAHFIDTVYKVKTWLENAQEKAA